jgi:SAM-dependent methyltransferase
MNDTPVFDIREEAARYYDLQNNPTADIPFFMERIPAPDARVLELGCGTGRVLLPLASGCGFIHGMDSSEAMLAMCRRKLDEAGLPPAKARVTRADIADFDLGEDERFDLIVAPFRVFQNLQNDVLVNGLFRCIDRHLAPGGSAILTAFNPNRTPDEMRRTWCVPGEQFDFERVLDDGTRLVRHHRRPRLQSDPLVVFPGTRLSSLRRGREPAGRGGSPHRHALLVPGRTCQRG